MRTKMNLGTIQLERVRSVYSGRDGACCCGCAGTHRYRAATQIEGGAHRGYAVDADEVNDRQVARVLAIINAATDREDCDDGTYAATVVGSRLYIAYLRAARQAVNAGEVEIGGGS